ncbi:MAG: MFS transporter [Anaerolineae bacterium]|jgi:MFS family permease
MNDSKRLLRTLVVANLFLYLGFNVWRAMFNNFAVEEIGVSATQIGLLQSLRELPGLMGFVLGFIAIWLSEMRIMGLSVLLMGVGLVATGWANGLGGLILGAMIMSVGFHWFYPSSNSLVLMGVDREEAPEVLGRLRSIAAFAAVIGTLVIWLFVEGLKLGPISIEPWGYRTTLFVIGGVVIAGGLLSLRNGRHRTEQRENRKVIFRREYWLYYLLTFMMGSRRHIFSTFAIFLLVQVYGISVGETALLFLANSVISTVVLPQLGKLVARFGERRVLSFNFVGLIGVFLGYAWIPNLAVLYTLFILDNLFFGFNLAVESYFQKIALSREEITSNVSMAQTINHISALVVPILGGILWEQISPSATFMAGVVIAAVSLVLVQFIRTESVAVPVPVVVD